MKLLKKYLNDERINVEDGEIKLSLRPLNTSQQARLIELAVPPGIACRIDQTNWCLQNCVEKVSVSGTEFVPAELCDNVNLADESTVAAYIKIGTMVVNVAFAQDEDTKK